MQTKTIRREISDNPLTEVMYRTVIVLAKTHEDNYKALALARANGWEQGSCTGIGLSKITLLCTGGEAADYSQALRQAGVENHVIGDMDAPHRPHTWQEASLRPNWSETLVTLS